MEKTDEMTYNERNVAEFRANGGRIDSFGDAPVLLLTTTGAKSGLQRTNPLMYLADEQNPDRVYVFASAAGADANPGWFHNLVAHPDSVKVEIGAQATAADAEVVPEPLREELYAVQASRYPAFASYQEKAERRIPVVGLTLRR